MKKKDKILKGRMAQKAPSEEPPPLPEDPAIPEVEDESDREAVEYAKPNPTNEEILRQPWTSYVFFAFRPRNVT
jgi:hypothetical protein